MKTLTQKNPEKSAKIVANIITFVIAGLALAYICKTLIMQTTHLHVFGL